MGNACDKFHQSVKPSSDTAKNPNKNICTTYSDLSLYDPSDKTKNAITVGNIYENGNSAQVIPPEVCIQNKLLAEEISAGVTAALTGGILPYVITAGGIEVAAYTINSAEQVKNIQNNANIKGGGNEFIIGYCSSIGDVAIDENGNLVPEWVPVTSQDLGDKIDNKINNKSQNSVLGAINKTCHYNDCDNKTAIDSAADCCQGCCSILGTKIACKRNAFLADKTVCCFLDNDCSNISNNDSNSADNSTSGIEDSCWQTSERRKTCDPNYRNLKSPQCLENIKPYCAGDKLFAGQNHWMELWLPNSAVDINSGQNGIATVENADGSNKRVLKQPCLRALARAVYEESGSKVCTWEQFQQLDSFQGTVSPAGVTWANEVLDSILDKYLNEFGSPIGSVNEDGVIQSSSFLDFYWNLCNTYPAICKNSLTRFCNDIKVNDILEKPDALKFCACYMTQDQYEKYERFNISRECTPLCNRKGVVPLVDEANIPKICQQNVCIIDDVNLNLNKVINPERFNFNQVCNSCGNNANGINFNGANQSKTGGSNENGNIIVFENNDSTFAQFIPDKSGIKFWYTQIDWPNALKDENGDLVVMLSAVRSNSEGRDFYPVCQAFNPVVTLETNQNKVSNFKSTTLNGTLYNITGIKNYYYNGAYPFNEGKVAMVSYMSKEVLKSGQKVSDLTEDQFKDVNNFISFGNRVDDPDFGCNPKYDDSDIKKYQGITWDFQPNNVSDYTNDFFTLTTKRKIADEFIVRLGFDPLTGSPLLTLKPTIWNCWNHYAKVFRGSISNKNSQFINNVVREDTISRVSNTCQCILDNETINIRSATVNNLDLNNNCGSAQCYNSKGETIPCGSATIGSVTIDKIEDTLKDFEQSLVTDKRKTISLSLLVILVFIIFVYIFTRSKIRRSR